MAKCRFCKLDVRGPSCLTADIAKQCEDYRKAKGKKEVKK